MNAVAMALAHDGHRTSIMDLLGMVDLATCLLKERQLFVNDNRVSSLRNTISIDEDVRWQVDSVVDPPGGAEFSACLSTQLHLPDDLSA